MGSKILMAAACLAIAGPATAYADTYTLYLQDSTIVGSGSTLTIRRLPFIYNGKTYYNDVTIPFTAMAPSGSNGALVKAGAATGVTSPTFASNHFVAGVYTTPGAPNDQTIRVTGPAIGAVAGTTLWSLAATTPDSYTPILNAQWTVGPLSASPAVVALINYWQIPVDPNATYGIGNTGPCLFAFTQINTTLTIREYRGTSLYATYTYTYSSP